jgi:pimeloyl-ACP methyl ester carboxylesterase
VAAGVATVVVAPATASASTPPAWGPSDEGFWTTPDGESVYYACYGDGSPVIIIEAGDSASQEYGRTFLEPLAERTTTCVYDRLGHGASDPPLAPVRTLDDTGAVLEGLLAGTGLPAPYVLVGQSLGGNLQIDFAAHHPDEVAGLVLIEAAHDDPEAMAAWQAEEGFEWTDNPDHVHGLDATIRLDELPLPFGEFPVMVISATHSDEGNVENQAYWLDISPNSMQVVLEGSHNLHFDAPDAVTDLILCMLDNLDSVSACKPAEG